MRVAGYPHRKAVHCGSGTLVSALAHRGLFLSEPMAFGLGAGLGFALHAIADAWFPRWTAGTP